MIYILMLFATALGSILDPVNLIGYVVSGALIRNYWGAIAASSSWCLFMYLVMIPVFIPLQFRRPMSAFDLAGCVLGAVIVGSIAFAVARSFRSKGEPEKTHDSQPSSEGESNE